jgi:glutamate--cysteine ligase
MFANSPLNGGRFSGYLCNRLHIAQNFDSERTHARKNFFEDDFDFEKWIDFVIHLPAFYIERKQKIITFTGQTFADFMQNGYNGYYPRQKDFIAHLKSAWTELVIKKYVEFRSFDSVPPHLIPSTAAIIKGLTLNNDTMDAVNKIMEGVSFSEYCQLRDDVNKFALQADCKGKKVLDFAKELLEIASKSLKNTLVKIF